MSTTIIILTAIFIGFMAGELIFKLDCFLVKLIQDRCCKNALKKVLMEEQNKR